MEHTKGLERQLQERVDAMQREQLQDPQIHLDSDPESIAEPTDMTPSEFGKGA